MKSKPHWNPMVPELLVTDYPKSLAFYTNVLGFNVLYSRTKPDFSYLDQGEAQIMIEQWEDNSWTTGPLNYPLGRGINFQIELAEISSIYERLQTLSYPLFMDIKENWYQCDSVEIGQQEFLVQDPDGYLLRFCQTLGER